MTMHQVDLQAFAERMKAAREESGLTYKEFADKAECTKETLRNYEKGLNPPELKTITRVSEALGLKVEDLVPEYKGLKTVQERLRTEDWSDSTIREIAEACKVCEGTIWRELSNVRWKYGVAVRYKTLPRGGYGNANGRRRWVKPTQCKTCGYRCHVSGRVACQYILIAGKQRPTPTEPGVCPAYEKSGEPYDCSDGIFERECAS